MDMAAFDEVRPAVRTVWWAEDEQGPMVCMLDQSLLPQHVSYVQLRHEQDVAEAIATLKVRGAPAIGVSAAFGMALALQRFLRFQQEQGAPLTAQQLREHMQAVGSLLARTRPTAVNLFWAIERMLRCLEQVLVDQQACSTLHTPQQEALGQRLLQEAQHIAAEDVVACLQMGRYGSDLIADGDILLTHCNAGALATVGVGTALAPFYIAHSQGKHIHVFVDETRPVLQGARLTAWELQQEGIPLTLITDNMAAHFMRHAGIKGVFVGADRITANGDVANKIGTYGVAVLAHAHQIPFYVVAPCSTIDLALASGDLIPIEQRQPQEITSVRGVEVAPAGVHVANPAFDVTPHSYVTAIITENGVARPPYESSLRQLCRTKEHESTGKVHC